MMSILDRICLVEASSYYYTFIYVHTFGPTS
jgi:hypothetical protein